MKLRVGVIDLVSRKPSRSLYDRVMLPNFVSIIPQAIATWAEEFGHQAHYAIYTGREDLDRALPDDVDLVFISAFTPAAYLAYALSNRLRRKGVVTVLGGPHARAYADDALDHFDYVTHFVDRTLVRDLFQGFARAEGRGTLLSAARQPDDLPSVRARWKFVRRALDQAFLLAVVPMIGSLGCPYQCSFCIDSRVRYAPLPSDAIREDLLFLQRVMKRPIVGWHDPNFGVRFDEILGLIEECVPPGKMHFVAESSLSNLSEDRLARMQEQRFEGLTIGIESWSGFDDKARARGGRRETQKVRAVAEQVDLVTRHIPYVQTNFVWGLDSDEGPRPFALTKEFIDRAPAAYPSHALYTAYGDSAPDSERLFSEGRALDVPFSFQDTSTIHNVELEHYGGAEFYDRMADLVRHSFGPGPAWRRVRATPHPWTSAARWMVGIRSLSEAYRIARFSWLADRFRSDPEFRSFEKAATSVTPRVFREAVRTDLGPYYAELPAHLRAELERPLRLGGPRSKVAERGTELRARAS